METDILISNIEKFLSEYYGEICTSKSKNISYLDIDFKDLIQYDPDFADMLIDDFENVEQTFGIVLTDLFEAKKVKPRFKNITNAIKKDIWKIRSKDVDKLIVIEGYIRRIAPIQHEIISARFECPSCGNITTIFMQEGIFKKPTVCSCGRKGKFNLVSKEIRDVRKLVVEDDPLLVKPPQKPGAILVNLSEDLCREGIDKFLQPSKKVKIIGLLKDRQVKPYLTICKKYIEANSIEILDETIEKIKFSKKDVEEFESIAKKKNLYKDLAQSIIPNIEGHVTVKTAILLQLMGGVSLFMDDRLEERGLIHILLVGSPGCLCGNTYITLSDGTFKKIKSFGNVHLEQINNYLRIDKRGPAESPIAKAEVFHKYLNQKTIKITTQTGKEIICNYNHPFWVKRNEVSSTRNKKCWIKAEDLRLNDSIKVMRKIQCTKKRYEQLNPDFSNVARQAKEIKIPFCNEDVAFLWGYIIGDGCVHKGYELIIYINENEQELIPRITKLINTNFGIKERIKKIKKGDGIIGNRIIHRSEPIYEIHYDSKKLAIIFAMPKQPYRTIPEIIMASKKSVVAYFLRGLFDADGCCTISYKNREHRAPCPKIQLKSSSHQLLLDTQLLLIKFGIQARINQDNLIIARSDDIIIYNKEIGFTVKKKKAKLQEAIKIANRNRKNRKLLLYEKIIKLDENEKQTVYDIEVPKVHRFISNGLISHNTGKSVMLKRATEFLPRSRFTGGRGISGVGLIGAVIKDEEMGGYILDIGAVPLSSNSMIAIDECFPADTEILTEKGFVRFDSLIQGIKVAQFHKNNKITFIKPKRIVTNMYEGDLLKVKSFFGEHISTPNHKRVVLDKNKKLKKLEVMNSLSTLNKVPVNGVYNGKGVDFSDDELRFIVAFTADGCIKNNCYGYIKIKKKRKIKRLEEICTKAGITFSCNKSENYSYYFGKIIEKYFPKVDGKVIKNFKEEWIYWLSLRQKEIILQELMYWDGYKCSKNNCWQFFTSRLDYLNFICSLASTSGYYTHIYGRKKGNYKINYSLTFTNKKYKTQQKLKVTKIPYKGLVYCVTVPSGMIVIKQNNYIQISGNCDKISRTDVAFMNNAMVDLQVKVDKGNVHQTIETNTIVLAAANPKNRVFDKNELVWKQIGLPKDFLDRFDLIFPVQSGISIEEKKRVAQLVVGKYRVGSKLAKPIYPHDLVVKYIAYARKNFAPELTKKTEKYIVDNFINIVKPADPHEDSAYFSYRLLTNIIRLSQASARTRLSNEVTIQDTKLAIDILLESLKAQDIITPEGLFDYERAEAIVPKEKRNIRFSLIKLIRSIQEVDERKLARYDIIKERALNELEIDIDKLDEIIEKLRQEGDIIEITRGKYKILE